MKKLLCVLLAVAMLASLSLPALADGADQYDGVEPGAWYAAAAKRVIDQGLMSSTGNGFDPAALVTRATVFQTLYNLEGKPDVDYPTGNLLEWNAALNGVTGHWWTSSALWAYATHLTSGDGSTYAGDRAVTRAELVTILYRYAQYKAQDVSVGENTNILSYDDAELIQVWAVEAFRWAAGAGVVTGKTDNRLAPNDTATRAELAQVLANYTATLTQEPTAPAQEPTAPADPLADQLSTARTDYPSDAAFANFRAVTVGNIAADTLYRSASPVDPATGRATYADALIRAAGVETIVNMADCRYRVGNYEGYADTYAAAKAETTVHLNMKPDDDREEHCSDLKNALEFLSENRGPYLICSTHGNTRTGELCFLLEALMGANLRDLVAEYMLSYENLYHVKYDSEQWSDLAAQTVEQLAIDLTGADDIFSAGDADLAAAAEEYILHTVGLSADDLAALRANLSAQ